VGLVAQTGRGGKPQLLQDPLTQLHRLRCADTLDEPTLLTTSAGFT
jgi:hypothetical protein